MTSNQNLKAALRELMRAYVGLLEAARERIIFHGGTCDSVETMERSDPYLKRSLSALNADETPARRTSPNDAVRWVCSRCGTVNSNADSVCCVHSCAGRRPATWPPEETSGQAPIAKVVVRESGAGHYAPDDVSVSLYAPGLPPGEHDLYCEPTSRMPPLTASCSSDHTEPDERTPEDREYDRGWGNGWVAGREQALNPGKPATPVEPTCGLCGKPGITESVRTCCPEGAARDIASGRTVMRQENGKPVNPVTSGPCSVCGTTDGHHGFGCPL